MRDRVVQGPCFVSAEPTQILRKVDYTQSRGMETYEACPWATKHLKADADQPLLYVVVSWLLELLDEPGVKHAVRLFPVA